MPWAIKWRRDGRSAHLLGRRCAVGLGQPAEHLSGYTTMVFRTREQARDFARRHYGQDSRTKFWKPPLVVKVRVEVLEL